MQLAVAIHGGIGCRRCRWRERALQLRLHGEGGAAAATMAYGWLIATNRWRCMVRPVPQAVNGIVDEAAAKGIRLG